MNSCPEINRANQSALTQISGGKYSSFLQILGDFSTSLIATDQRFSQPEMRDLRRLLKYLRPHWPIFTLATFAMLIVGVLESAIGGLIVPIFDQAFVQGAGQRTSTIFGLQHLIPQAPFGAWKMISILLIVFTVAKGIAEYFSTYLMARIGQSAVVRGPYLGPGSSAVAMRSTANRDVRT